MTTTDHATPERLHWLRVTEPHISPRPMRICRPEPHQRIDKLIDKLADETTDADIKRRSDEAWDRVRERGNRPTVEEA
jgi:hypothetical protein